MPPLAADARDYLADTARRLDAAAHGETGAIVSAACEHLGWSVSKLYARLAADVGWSSGRKTRRDKGTSCVAPENLDMLAAAQRESLRANGKQILFTPDAASVLEQSGIGLPVGDRQLNRLMRDRKLNVGAQRQAHAAQRLRSLHPNHVHQVDPSLCVLYYLKNGQQAMMEADQFYKNKLENYNKVKLKVWRYVLWDHTTSMVVFRYYEARAENPATLFDFLMWAWGRQDGREFHGVPRILVWDKGSANTATTIKGLLEGLEVRPIEHAAGKARVKGGVEGAQNIVECKFESRLKFEPVANVEELNSAALAWQNAFNADLIPRQDNRLKRHGMAPTARYDLWRRIKAEELRILPPVEVCRPLLAGREEVRTVRDMKISFRHPAAERTRIYRVAGLDGICNGDEVAVRPLLFGDCAIHLRVARYDGGDLVYRVEPEGQFDSYGMPVSAPVIGEEFKSLPDTAADKAGKRMDALAYPEQDAEAARRKQQAPFGGGLNAHSHLKDIALPVGLPRRGSEIHVPDRIEVEATNLTTVEAAMAFSREAWWNGEMFALLTKWYPDGVPAADLPAVGDRLRTAPRLVAVG